MSYQPQPLFWVHPDQPSKFNFDLIHPMDLNFDNFVAEEGVTLFYHEDFATMYQSHIDYQHSLAYEASMPDYSYRTDQEIAEDKFLFIEDTEDDTILDAQFEDLIPF